MIDEICRRAQFLRELPEEKDGSLLMAPDGSQDGPEHSHDD